MFSSEIIFTVRIISYELKKQNLSCFASTPNCSHRWVPVTYFYIFCYHLTNASHAPVCIMHLYGIFGLSTNWKECSLRIILYIALVDWVLEYYMYAKANVYLCCVTFLLFQTQKTTPCAVDDYLFIRCRAILIRSTCCCHPTAAWLHMIVLWICCCRMFVEVTKKMCVYFPNVTSECVCANLLRFDLTFDFTFFFVRINNWYRSQLISFLSLTYSQYLYL